MLSQVISAITAFALLHVVSADYDYYWRKYDGIIPDDAIPGGIDVNSQTTYIGQVFILPKGLFPTRIYPGVKEVTTSRYGIHTSDTFVNILCGKRPEDFSWLPATAENLHRETIGTHMVEGGTEVNQILNIGRAQYQGELIVGKVCSYVARDAKLFFPFKGTEVSLKSYEVLVYKKTEPNEKDAIAMDIRTSSI